MRVGAQAHASSGGADVGLLALGRSRDLANANYCAKLLAKYVPLRHIRVLRGRFMVRGNSVFLKGDILKLIKYWFIC